MKWLRNFLLIFCISAYVFNTAQAEPSLQTVSPELERAYLVQLVNQLQAMTPLITAAQKAQPKNQRIAFHYTAWRDAKGQSHNGLLEDVQAIKAGIEEKLNAVTIEPRAVQPIQGDYLDPTQKNKSSNALQ